MKKFLFLFLYFLNSAVFADALPVKLFNVTIGDPVEKYLTEYVSQNNDTFLDIKSLESIEHSNNPLAEKKYFIYPDTDRKIKKKEYQNPEDESKEVPEDESKEVKDIDENMYITEDGSPYFRFTDECTQDNEFKTVNFSDEKMSNLFAKARWEKYIKEREKEKKENQLTEDKETEKPKKKSSGPFSFIFDLIAPSTSSIFLDRGNFSNFPYWNPGEFNPDTYLYDPEIRLQLLNMVTRNKHLSCYNIHANEENIVVGIESYENFYNPNYNDFSNNACLKLKNDFINVFTTVYEIDNQSFSNRFFIKKHYTRVFDLPDRTFKSGVIFAQKDVSGINYSIDEKKLVLSVSCLYTKSVATLSINLLNEERHNDFMFRYKGDSLFSPRPINESELMKEVNSINVSLLNTDISGLL